MRSLGKDKLDLIDALVAESDVGGITAGLLEKDEHLTDALRAIFSLQVPGLRLVFCGGTSLSKAHLLIERMSEDADIKVVLSDDAMRWTKSRLRKELGNLRSLVATTLKSIDFVEDGGRALSWNDNRYIHSQWAYKRRYDTVSGLRPNLQLELTTRSPVLPTQVASLCSLTSRLTKQEDRPFSVEAVSAAETESEKILSFLRRFAQNRAGKLNQLWDTALVRHIYDVHCIHANRPDLLNTAASAFPRLVHDDRFDIGRQHAAFFLDPLLVLEEALAQVGNDSLTRGEYERNLIPLIYGKVKPDFDEAFTSFALVAQTCISAMKVTDTDGTDVSDTPVKDPSTIHRG